MLLTIEGTFKDGKVQLSETPHDVREAKVLVTFLGPTPPRLSPQMMRFGQFSGPAEKMSTEDDFRSAEWRGARDDDN
jgi:hypothetical protein